MEVKTNTLSETHWLMYMQNNIFVLWGSFHKDPIVTLL